LLREGYSVKALLRKVYSVKALLHWFTSVIPYTYVKCFRKIIPLIFNEFLFNLSK
jgi:hypothetical protein